MGIIKVSDEHSEKTFAQLREVLEVDNPDTKDYEIAYGTRTKTRNYIVYQKTTIYNYVFGYTKTMDKFFVSSVSINSKDNFTLSEPVFFTKDDVQTMTRKITGTINIKLKDGFKSAFTIPPYTLKSAGYNLPVSQKEKSKFLNDFIKNNPIKK